MSNPRTFISFDFDHDETEKNLFIGQTKNSKTPFNIEDWSSKNELPEDEWENIIKDKINKCHLIIVLCGKTMASANGVVKEIKMAKEQNIPYFGVYVDGSNSKSNLPKGLERNRTIQWNWDNISNAIDQLMKEGKNAK
jgi:hypothetical protein